jgi:hypothetical protein
MHIGYGPNWKIWISSKSPFQGDSKSGVPKFVSFLIRQENPNIDETQQFQNLTFKLDGSVSRSVFLRRL